MEPLKVFGWALDHGGCGNYRIGLPMWALGLIGHDARAFSVLNVDIPADLDILVGQLVKTPDRAEVWAKLAADPNRSFGMIYEIDDDVWNLVPSNPSYGSFTAASLQIAIDSMRLADAVTVTTDHLADVVSKYNSNVFVLPNCVDGSLLKHERPRAEQLTVGWAGGSSHTDDFESVGKDLRSFFRRNPGISSHFVGVNYGGLVGRPDTRYTSWADNLVDYLEVLDFDIGIAPLAYNTFNRSKSDLKFVEFAALGIPVVASDFGPYAESIAHEVTGMLVRYPHEWAKYLNKLAKDAEFREALSTTARAWASTRTIQSNIWRWEEVYRKVSGQ